MIWQTFLFFIHAMFIFVSDMKLMEALYFDTHFDFVVSNDISVSA